MLENLHLSPALAAYANRDDVLVLALHEQGIVAAAQVARALGVALEFFVARELAPQLQDEVAMGTAATGAAPVLVRDVVARLGIDPNVIAKLAEAEAERAARRELGSGGHRLDLIGRTVLVIDDGSMERAALETAVAALEKLDAARVLVATVTSRSWA